MFNSTSTSSNSQKRESLKRRLSVTSGSYEELLICGYSVMLPCGIKPYSTQRTMIAKILTSLKNKLNALIESPTGSGKTLGLLSATCAWLVKYKMERMRSRGECKACGGQSSAAAATVNSEVKPTGLITENPVKETTPSETSTLDDEFDADFCTTSITSFNMSKKAVAAAKLDETSASSADKEQSDGHTCLPRITIYYGTRTHKQIGQVVKEFSRLPYSREGTIKHTILASREHFCINRVARATSDVNAKCKELIDPEGVGCPMKNAMRMKFERPSAIRRLITQTVGKANHIWDVEDLVQVLRSSTPSICPYFSTARVLIDDADIVFCPFSYLIDPIIRANSGLSLKNTIVILDEAHNVEDVCREAASYTFTEKEIVATAIEFRGKAMEVESEIAKVDSVVKAHEGLIGSEGNYTERLQTTLHTMKGHFRAVNTYLDEVLSWFVAVGTEALKKIPVKNDRVAYTCSWEKLAVSFEKAGLLKYDTYGRGTPYTILLEAFVAISGSGNENDDMQMYIRQYKPTSIAIVCIEKFLYFMKPYFKEDNRTAYKLFLCIDKPYRPFGRSSSYGLAQNFEAEDVPSHSEILDMSAYSRERQQLISNSKIKDYHELKKGCRVTANFWCMRPSLAYLGAFKGCHSVILASGTLCPTDTFQTELGAKFQQQMEGLQIIPKERIFAAVVPAGPNGYKLCGTYRNLNEDDRFIQEIAHILREICKIVPRGILCFFTSYRVLNQIYEYMEVVGILRQIQSIKVVLREPRRSTLMSNVMTDYENAVENPRRYGPQCTGAIMFAVFRGKVSEGIDFADDRARCVITVGIPYPSSVDEQVIEKKKYNDANCKKLQIVSGDEWYIMQAYRALNQALGRCLRHRLDWGAILMLDERLQQINGNPNARKISKWIREQLRPLSSFEHFTAELAQFVASMEGEGKTPMIKFEV